MTLARSSAPGEFIEASNSPPERTAGSHALAAAQIEREITLDGEQRERLLAIAEWCQAHRTPTSEIDLRTRLASR